MEIFKSPYAKIILCILYRQSKYIKNILYIFSENKTYLGKQSGLGKKQKNIITFFFTTDITSESFCIDGVIV